MTKFDNLYSNIKTENPLQYLLQMILMHTHSFGGQVVTAETKLFCKKIRLFFTT